MDDSGRGKGYNPYGPLVYILHNYYKKGKGFPAGYEICDSPRPYLYQGRKIGYSLASMITLFIQILFTIFVVVDPFGIVPLYIGLTARLTAEEKKRTIKRALITALLILSLFIIAGKWVLLILNVHPGSFFIAGGIMLFIVSLEMLFGQANRSKVSSNETPREEDEDERTSVAIFPLAIPMLAGPGAITTILLFTSSQHPLYIIMPMLFIAVLFTLLVTGVSMGASELILKALGRTGVSVIERIMVLLLSGMSVQFVYDRLVKLGIIIKVAQ